MWCRNVEHYLYDFDSICCYCFLISICPPRPMDNSVFALQPFSPSQYLLSSSQYLCTRGIVQSSSDLSGQNFYSFSCPERQWQRWTRNRMLKNIQFPPLDVGKPAEQIKWMDMSWQCPNRGDCFSMWDGASCLIRKSVLALKPFLMKALIEILLTLVRINWWFQMKIKLKFCHCF